MVGIVLTLERCRPNLTSQNATEGLRPQSRVVPQNTPAAPTRAESFVELTSRATVDVLLGRSPRVRTAESRTMAAMAPSVPMAVAPMTSPRPFQSQPSPSAFGWHFELESARYVRPPAARGRPTRRAAETPAW